ncbi:isochorismatase family protein [Jeotgalibacillus malaysiensis]|uniref:Isochorismatase family protein n=1 Tax=Jeotgalibacillus malaysiensis TaxID=1508404 RepID=A0A0B5AIJ7_9BACL|nr:isochorismatase family cysteine hydrolase [Jeotgalibacillus malaysiensis]AJD89866.1 isochorismatase family protein [Jeotgalibacillus malaysiensis]
MKKTALLLIDMMNHMEFEGGDDLLKHTLNMIDRLAALKKRVKEKDIPVIYVNDNFDHWQDNTDAVVEECLNAKGKPVVEKIRPEDDDYFIIKPKHSGFFGTQLDILLKQLEVERVIIAGVATDICVLFTANDAHMREYEICVPEDCSAAETQEAHDSAMRIIEQSLDADIRKGEEIPIGE